MSVTAALTELIAADAAVAPSLGAPGVYFAPASAADTLDVEAMDVAAFVGIAPRGPAWVTTTDPENGEEYRARSVAVAVDSWDDYVELYGGIEGDMQLARAVSAYFAQGARRAYIIRVVHPAEPWQRPSPWESPPGCAELAFRFVVKKQERTWLTVVASNEGSWGDLLEVQATFTLRRIGTVKPATPEGPAESAKVSLPRAGLLTPWATVRFSPPAQILGLGASHSVRYGVIRDVAREMHPEDPNAPFAATLEPGVSLEARTVIDVVEANISVTDRDPSRRRHETHTGLGLHEHHPRYLGTVLNEQSRLLQVLAPPDPTLLDLAITAGRLDFETSTGGHDRWSDITPEDFFPRAEPAGTGGIDALEGADEVATIVAPDLYWPPARRSKPMELPDPSPSGEFVCCPDRPSVRPAPPPDSPSRLTLDPRDADNRARIVARQRDLTDTAERMHRIALVDVPPGLTDAQIQAWRAQFDSAFGAAYHPWLAIPARFGRTLAVTPSAVAAGIIARTGLVSGLARGPANAVATGVADVDAVVSPDDHAVLHRLGVNVFFVDTDGVRLSAARTLSSDAQWRQLSVRRLLLSIEKSVRNQLQWCVFENNDDRLRDNIRSQLDALMAALFAQGCFAGSTPEESWFVRIASGPDAQREQDAGQLIAEIGVAPAEPLEFIIVRVAVQAEGEIKSSFVSGEVSARG